MQAIESIARETDSKAASFAAIAISDNLNLHDDQYFPQEEKTRRVPIENIPAQPSLDVTSVLNRIEAALIGDSSDVFNQSLNTTDRTISEVLAAIKNGIAGRTKDSVITAIEALMSAPDDSWQVLSQEYSWLIRVEPDIPETLSLEGAILRLFRVKCGNELSYRNATMTRIRKCSKLRNPKARRLKSLILLLIPSTMPLVVRWQK